MLTSAALAAQSSSTRDLADLSLEELGNVQVTSVSGRAEPLQSAPASVYVITHEEIRRSTATTLPEVLRLAPNLLVAQSSAGTYAISARGFNNEISNKLLVLIDGRTVYSNLFSGVFWDANAVMLEDIDRVEVISGPGGTLWGANAVNGVINVITRDAAATQGALASLTLTDGGFRQAIRWGGKLGDNAYFRLYGLATARDSTKLGSGLRRLDDSDAQQIGFRADWHDGPSQVTLQGDAYQGGSSPYSNLKPKLQGGNVLVRLSSRMPDGSRYKIQAYYDTAARDEVAVLNNKSRNVDVEFTHEPNMPAGQQLLWGLGYRRGHDDNEPTLLVRFTPDERILSRTHIFAQHQLQLSRQWQLTVGAKAEQNNYSGTELLPNARLAFQHSPSHLTWAAVSRAVRSPARLDRDFFFPGNAPYMIAGGPNFQSEKADVVELGHHGQLGTSLSYSATLFRQYYSGLRAGIPGTVPALVENQIEGPAQGVEAWAKWQVSPDWRLAGGYLGLRKLLRFSSGASDATSIPNLGNDPQSQWSLRSTLNINTRTELDLMLRHVGDLPSPTVAGYSALDARLGFKVNRSLELSLLAQNLFEKRHVEFNAAGVASQIEPKVYVRAIWSL